MLSSSVILKKAADLYQKINELLQTKELTIFGEKGEELFGEINP